MAAKRLSLPAVFGWSLVAIAGAAAFAVVALARGETVGALWLIVAALCTYAVGYRCLLYTSPSPRD